jgi:hypothetical protein
MIKLIPNSYLNEACFLSLNADDKKYEIVLKDAQMDLEDILGQEYYTEITTQYRAKTFTAPNNTLYEDYLKDFLAWQTFYHYLKFSNVDMTPTGAREFSEDNSTIIADVKMYSLEKNVLNKATRYKFRMLNFLKNEQAKDSTAYPLYKAKCMDQVSFTITAIDKSSDKLIKVNKAINTNE